MDNIEITPEMARKELARRELERRGKSLNNDDQNIPTKKKSYDLFSPGNVDQKQFKDQMLKTMTHGFAGLPQGAANSLIGIANLIPGVNLNKLDLAPHSEESQAGQLVGDVGSYYGPRGVVGLTKIPKLVRESSPVIKNLLKTLGAGSEGALFGASHAKEGEKALEALKGGGLGTGMHVANAFLASQFPLLARLGQIGIGAGIGNMFGHPGYGAMAGGLAPQLKGAVFGPSQLKLAENALKDINPKNIQKSLKANKALGTIPTPGQAEGSYVIQGREGALRKQAGKLGEDLEIGSLNQQKKAAKEMLDNIYKPTSKSQQEISSAYKLAEQKNINTPEFWNAVKKKYPILNDAMKTVKSDPAFSNVPETNYKFLAEVDRQLGRDYRGSLQTNPNSAHAIKNMKAEFRKFLVSNNPEYEKALKLAAPKKARQNIEEKLNLHEEQLTGKNIHKALLSTPKKYMEALRILKPYPKASKSLVNMRHGWKEFANIKTGSQAESQAKTRIDQARNIVNWVNDFLESTVGKKSTEAQLKYLHSKEWPKGFDLIKNAKTQAEQINKLMDLVGRTGIAYGLSNKEVQNLKSLIKEKSEK